MIGVYRITNTINQKFYVGSSSDIDRRWRDHKAHLTRNKHWNPHLQAAWNLYGSDSFRFDVLEVVSDPSKLIEREQFWLDLLKPYVSEVGYNIAVCAASPMRGRKFGTHTEEVKQKLRIANRGKKLTEETKQKISLGKTGKKYAPGTHPRLGKKNSEESKLRARQFRHTKEARQKISKSLLGNKNSLGFKRSEETKQKISLAMRARNQVASGGSSNGR